MRLPQLFLICGALSIMALYSGCGDKQDTQVYTVAKPLPEATPAVSPSAAMPAGMPPGHPSVGAPAAMPPGHPGIEGMTAAGSANDQPNPEINLGTPPSRWEKQPPTTMRVASFLVKGEKEAVADISLILLSGAAGGVLDNVNRWESQLGQPNLTEDQLATKTQRINSPLGEMTVVDIQGLPAGADAAKDGRIVAAIVVNEGMAYFFKMRGNSDLVGTQKADFIQWISSVKAAGAKADAKSPAPTAPATDSAAPAGSPVSPK